MKSLALSHKLHPISARDNGNGIDVLILFTLSYFTFYVIVNSVKSVKYGVKTVNFMTLQFYLSVNIVIYILFYGLKDICKVK